MSKLLGTSRCPKCAERGKDRRANNLAEYPDGFHCFACGYRKSKKSHIKRLEPLKSDNIYSGILTDKKLPIDALKWLLEYNLTLKEMEGFSYAYKRVVKGYEIPCSMLVLINTDDYWLGRNLSNVGVRYLSSGAKPFVKYGNNPGILVFTEDIISAIKVGRVATAVPMLGAKIPAQWLEKCKGYSRVVIWGDYDKKIDNIFAARKASEVLGKQVQSVITEKDPKYYNTEEICQFLNINI